MSERRQSILAGPRKINPRVAAGDREDVPRM